MKQYDITKYKDRHDKKKYKNDKSWTAISDIGEVYECIKVTEDIYMQTENAYVDSIIEILHYMKIEYLNITYIELRWGNSHERTERISNLFYKHLYTERMLNFYKTIDNKTIINLTELSDLIRLQLREDIFASISVPYRFKLFIGYDYLMGVHTSIVLEPLFKSIKSKGLNIFRFP